MTTPIELNVLCAGACQGLVKALQTDFTKATGAIVTSRFGAVGAMKEALLSGTPCDLMIVTDAMITTLAEAGELSAPTRRALGRVKTGIAVRAGEGRPDISGADALRAALLLSDGIYFPDPERATAGIHFAGVMKTLGIHDAVASRFRTFPNGATAMAELARSELPRLIGCTQVTEINYTEGVTLAGALPDAFELSTVYTAAVSAKAVSGELASRFIEMLAGEKYAALRASGGFEPV